MKTTKSIYKCGVICGVAVDEKTKAAARDAILIRKSLENYAEQRQIEGYKNLYKVIMKLKYSGK